MVHTTIQEMQQQMLHFKINLQYGEIAKFVWIIVLSYLVLSYKY